MAARHCPDSVPPPASAYPEPIASDAASQLPPIDQATHNRIVNFLWGIADDVLRDLFRRGKYPDVILPMGVLRRLDAVLEPSKAKLLEAKARLDARCSAGGGGQSVAAAVR